MPPPLSERGGVIRSMVVARERKAELADDLSLRPARFTRLCGAELRCGLSWSEGKDAARSRSCCSWKPRVRESEGGSCESESEAGGASSVRAWCRCWGSVVGGAAEL